MALGFGAKTRRVREHSGQTCEHAQAESHGELEEEARE
jgi:hypothetical protein